MDVVFDLALMAHLLSLLAAGGVVIAMPLIADRMAGAPPEARPLLGAIAQRIGIFSRVAFLVLLISGPLMVWIRFGGVAGMNVWFWVKMGLIVLMIVAMVANGYFRKQGNMAAAGAVANLSRLALVGVILSAVLAFN